VSPTAAPQAPAFDLTIGRLPVDDFVTPRYELAGLPLIGGNSDVGLQVGGAVTLVRFEHGARPYAWKMDLVVRESVTGAGSLGSVFAQQYYVWEWDVPDLLGGKLRLTPAVYYQRAIDQGYFGLGNASSASPAAASSPQFFQYLDRELKVRELARIKLGAGFDLAVVSMFRGESPSAYPGSLLARDAATKTGDGTPLLRGIAAGASSSDTGIGMLGAGLIYDTRDNEIFPRSGAFHQIGFRAVGGLPLDRGVDYGGFDSNLVWMVPLLRRRVVLATRLVVDLEVGNVPFYDLYKGGAFQVDNMIGGGNAVRGVPSGRYLGQIKAMGNLELRSLPVEFHFLHQGFHLGGDAFFDAGRVWLDYSFHSPLDGSGLGLKWGVGGGLYALWGQAALFRVDVAYSPDQAAFNTRFPVAIYVDEGVMF
jgi:hypothetical protein